MAVPVRDATRSEPRLFEGPCSAGSYAWVIRRLDRDAGCFSASIGEVDQYAPKCVSAQGHSAVGGAMWVAVLPAEVGLDCDMAEVDTGQPPSLRCATIGPAESLCL